MTRRRPGRRTPALAVTLAVLAGVVGLLVLTGVPRSDSAADPSRGSGGSGDQGLAAAPAAPAGAVEVDARPARRAGAVRPEAPTLVRLPSGRTLGVDAVSTTAAGVLDVPHDVRRAGWWRGGSRLGDPWGSTLVAAHVDSTTQGLGPFSELLGVHRGERFTLSSATLRQTFRTVSLQLVPRGPLQRERWMFDASGSRRLVLVTCAPPYVRSEGGYQNLAVITAVPLGGPGRRAG